MRPQIRRICGILGERVRTRDQALQPCGQYVEQLPTHRLDDICPLHGYVAQLASNMLGLECCIDGRPSLWFAALQAAAADLSPRMFVLAYSVQKQHEY